MQAVHKCRKTGPKKRLAANMLWCARVGAKVVVARLAKAGAAKAGEHSCRLFGLGDKGVRPHYAEMNGHVRRAGGGEEWLLAPLVGSPMSRRGAWGEAL